VDKKDLAQRLAKEWRQSQAQAADELDTFIHRLFIELKKSAKNWKRQPQEESSMAPSKEAS
jgi:hypothetical protein